MHSLFVRLMQTGWLSVTILPACGHASRTCLPLKQLQQVMMPCSCKCNALHPLMESFLICIMGTRLSLQRKLPSPSVTVMYASVPSCLSGPADVLTIKSKSSYLCIPKSANRNSCSMLILAQMLYDLTLVQFCASRKSCALTSCLPAMST